MPQMQLELTYKVKFNKPEFNATYKFIRHESGAFNYGNQSAVAVFRNDICSEYIDTRYDKLVMEDFMKWCENYLKTAFDPEYEPTWRTIT